MELDDALRDIAERGEGTTLDDYADAAEQSEQSRDQVDAVRTFYPTERIQRNEDLRTQKSLAETGKCGAPGMDSIGSMHAPPS